MTAPASDLEAVVFDFHGTLVEGSGFSYEVATGVLLDTLASGGVELDASLFRATYRREVSRYLDERLRTGDEQHNTVWLARTLRVLGVPVEAGDERVVAAVDAYFARYERELSPLPGAGDLLASLAPRYRLGLLSNFTDARPVRGVLRREGLYRHFDCIVISADIGRCKPQPDAFRHVLEGLGAAAERTLFVGDDPRDDVQGAHDAGFRTAWLRRPDAPPMLRWVGDEGPPEGDAPADHRVERLEDLRQLLG